ncbi:protein NLP4-like [Andrographis paniculata]|uniref:protein NLP4-like n=1 Tax=Andrographis paniculata TaxID=175694 RepID=UPI0021E86FDE|nr:protein NLP4-like [Andrographis paniculata]XP_051126428.1 protein NLP4-like [Andrographis paniculata]
MEEGVVPLGTILATSGSTDCFMDLDYMDELLLEGCWLEANGSDFSAAVSPFDPAAVFPGWPSSILESNSGEFIGNGSDSPEKDDRQQRSSIDAASPGRPEQPLFDGGDHSSRRWWIGPEASISVVDRLIQALGYIKDCTRDKDALIQVWVPVTREGKRVLTTSNQPFSLDLNCPRLRHYREISVNYHFPAEEDSTEGVGLPGRVFASKVPEWTPDVRFFTRDEYPRVRHAQQVDVRGTLAVPILEQGSRNCLGVVEVVLTTQKVQYRPELETVCRALEAVDLRTAEISGSRNVKMCDLSYQAALPEILEVLRAASTSHRLPLAQTWVSCVLQGKDGCRHSEENLQNCVSPVAAACYIGDARIQGFHEACSDYHLLKDQGIVGRAFRTNQPCFSPDVTACSRTEYPLSHYARMFSLKSAVAIRLRSVCTGSSDFVLELFLPTDCVSPDEQKKMLTSLSAVIQNVCRTLRVVTDKEVLEESAVPENSITQEAPVSAAAAGSSRYNGWMNYSETGAAVKPRSEVRGDLTFGTDLSMSGDGSSLYTNKAGEKRRVKSDKVITLQVLRQHFAGSLKDAAKKLGVCPTTLKRICRQHGVQRWPSRKIKKVGHSLQKIQRVIDSVHGTSGVLQFDSFYSNFPELATSPNASRTSKNQKSVDVTPPEISVLKPPAAATAAASTSPSSSCSQSSGSSQCCSSGAQPPPSSSFSVVDNPTADNGKFSETMLKRARTDANFVTENESFKPLPSSKSHLSMSSSPEKPSEDHTVGERPVDPNALPLPRIKVTCGEDNIRFRMKSEWRYKDLLNEISRRFGVGGDPARFHLKYLDDDAEWVLLTCDADLDECLDVCRVSRSATIKLWFIPDSSMPSSGGSRVAGAGGRIPLSL